MKTIVLLGGPGAGKGTVAEALKEAAGMVHVSTGDMLRAAVKAGTAVGHDAEPFMKAGDLVPDDVILQIVEERLDNGDADAYMFDGFPRTVRQAEMFDACLAKRASQVNHVFSLEVSRDVLITRLTGRRICRDCGANFHVANLPPKQDGVCDQCGGELYQRPDDQLETIQNRLEVFDAQTRDLIAYYAERGVLEHIDAAHTPAVTLQAVLAVLN